jgi:hypothetical protein
VNQQLPIKAKLGEIEILAAGLPTFTPNYRRAPGCFDIVARGTFPRIDFTTEVVSSRKQRNL